MEREERLRRRAQTRAAMARYVDKRRDDPAFRRRLNANMQAYRERNREKQSAWNKVARALKAGKLTRAEACQRCGKACKTEASHDDYDKPLEVEWLCRPCHRAKDADAALAKRGAPCPSTD